jgi:hypothetical protein
MLLEKFVAPVVFHWVTWKSVWLLLRFTTSLDSLRMLCGSRGGAAHMLVCDRCYRGWHMVCMTPPMDVVFARRWVCLHCTLEG